jgi:exodeoxyribonuclease VII large subunit
VGELNLFSETSSSTDGAWRVADVTRRARQLIESGFSPIWVRGEVSGFKAYRSGHWYFTLRDADAQVRCIMWRSDNQRVKTPPDEGVEVFVEARPTVWEDRGEFRLTVKQLLPTAADGGWQIKLEQARAALDRDGLFDPSRKRPLPQFPFRIAVVTSVDGAALRDIVAVTERRWPVVELLVVPTRVQGEGVEAEIRAALQFADRLPDVDLVIVGRGGGSREDLWAFNTEIVARAVAAMSVPTIAAVGHETDVSLTELVADARAPTPSAAAEAAVPNLEHVQAGVDQMARRLGRGLTSRTQLAKERLARTTDRLTVAMGGLVDRDRSRVSELGAMLDALSPLRILARGYSVARSREGKVLRRIDDFVPDVPFTLTVGDGEVDAVPKAPADG